MKKLRVTVNGVSYDVDVEMLEDDDDGAVVYGSFPSTTGAAPRPMSGAGNSTPHAAPPVSSPTAPTAPPAPSPSSGGQDVLTSPIAGVIVEVKATVGATVQEGEPVVIIEAMKMNTNVSSPVAGKVKEVKVSSGDAVQQGQVLLTFE